MKRWRLNSSAAGRSPILSLLCIIMSDNSDCFSSLRCSDAIGPTTKGARTAHLMPRRSQSTSSSPSIRPKLRARRGCKDRPARIRSILVLEQARARGGRSRTTVARRTSSAGTRAGFWLEGRGATSTMNRRPGDGWLPHYYVIDPSPFLVSETCRAVWRLPWVPEYFLAGCATTWTTARRSLRIISTRFRRIEGRG